MQQHTRFFIVEIAVISYRQEYLGGAVSRCLVVGEGGGQWGNTGKRARRPGFAEV